VLIPSYCMSKPLNHPSTKYACTINLTRVSTLKMTFGTGLAELNKN